MNNNNYYSCNLLIIINNNLNNNLLIIIIIKSQADAESSQSTRTMFKFHVNKTALKRLKIQQISGTPRPYARLIKGQATRG